MAARRGATALLVCLLLLSVAIAGVGAVTATPDGDTVDGDVDENTTTDTSSTTDTGNNTTDTTDPVDNTSDTTDDTTDTGDDTTDTGDDTTDGTTDTTENSTDTAENTTDTVDNTNSDTTTDATNSLANSTETNTDGDTTGDAVTNTTSDTVTNTTGDATLGTATEVGDTTGGTLGDVAGIETDTLAEPSGVLDGTATLDGATTTLSGTVSGTTDTTVTGLLETTSTTVLGSNSGAGEREGSGSESATDGTASDSRDWTRERARSTSGSVVAADTAKAGTDPVSQPEPDATPRHLPLPDGTAATTAFVAGIVAIARPPVVTWGGAGQVETLATNHATAGFDRLQRFLVPLRYSRHDDSDPLDHEARAALYDAIESQPGVYLSDLSERADVNISTVRHHVRVLEDEGLVTSAKPHGKRRYYPAAADDHELAAALSEPATAAVLETLADLGTAHVGLLADEIDRDPSTVSHHLQRLADDGLVVRERDGRAVVNRLADPVADALTDGPTHGPAVADD